MGKKQQQRSRESREQILDVALELFSQQGYRGTTMREIAERCGRSTGIVYHHFPDKESIFTTLLDRYWEALEAPDHPINQALASGAFPDNLEELGRAARRSVSAYEPYIALIYVDVVELGGEHIRKFYSSMAERFERFVEEHPEMLEARQALRPDLSPGFAVMLATRTFLQYFAVEILFGVPSHFGLDSDASVHEIAEVLRRGMLRSDHESEPSPPSST